MKTSSRLIALAAAVLLAVFTGSVQAQSVYWTGSAGTNWDSTSWSTSANLAGTTTTPVNGNTLEFRQTMTGGNPTNRTMNNDITGLSVNRIILDNAATGYVFNGNALTVTGGFVRFGATGNTINLGLVLGFTTVGFQGQDALSALVINGDISETGGARNISVGSFNTPATSTSLTLSGNNSFSGTVQVGNKNVSSTVNINTLKNIGESQSLGTGSLIQFGWEVATGTVVYTGGTTSTDKTWSLGHDTGLTLNGGGAFINNGSGAVTWTGAQAFKAQNASVTRNFTLGGANTNDNTWQSAIKNNGTSGDNGLGTVSFTKTGAGKWILSGSNSYTGATTVSEGTLLINGSTAAGSAVTVASGAVFGGNGTVNGNLTLDNGAFFAFDTAYTLDLDVGSTFALNNSFGVGSLRNLNGGAINWGSITDGRYTLMNTSFVFDDSNIGNFGVANAADIGGSRTAYFDNGSLALVVVPEPSTWALLTGSLAALAIFRRRSKRS
jgi:autotransporter-associated beta strand protein